MESMRKPEGGQETSLDLIEQHILPGELNYMPDTRLPHFFSVLANHASRKLHSMYNEQFGLSVMGWRIMAVIGNHAPISAKAMCEMMATDAVTLSRGIDQLYGKGLVRRKTDPADRRRQLISLSKKGIEVFERIVPLYYAVEQAMMSALDETDQAHIRRIMPKIVAHSANVLSSETSWEEVLQRYGYRAEGEDIQRFE